MNSLFHYAKKAIGYSIYVVVLAIAIAALYFIVIGDFSYTYDIILQEDIHNGSIYHHARTPDIGKGSVSFTLPESSPKIAHTEELGSMACVDDGSKLSWSEWVQWHRDCVVAMATNDPIKFTASIVIGTVSIYYLLFC